MIKTRLLFLTAFIAFWNHTPAQQNGMHAGKILQSLKKLNTLGCVLYVAAHPDDENTRLLSYLANERNYRTVYLSMTRGDGGQNLIGKEQGVELGMIRTNELLEARKIDGAEQFFTRANDFGYSKNPEETFAFWNKDETLADVVYAIRKFQPDIIINRFPTTGEGGHGHHTASAVLAVEAFQAAGDPLRFPEQLKYVDTWQPKRIFHNSFVPRGQQPDYTGQLRLDVGGYNPLLGNSYGELASASRSMHKSQGFGVAVSRGQSFEYFRKVAGDTSVSEIMEGINTTWSRINGGERVEKLITAAIQQFDAAHPENSVASLMEILSQIRKTENSYWKKVKEIEVISLVKACSGLWMEANARDFSCSPGDTVSVQLSVISRTLPGVILKKVTLHNADSTLDLKLEKNTAAVFTKQITLSKTIEYSDPYWLKETYTPGRYTVSDPVKRGMPVNGPALIAEFQVMIGNEMLTYAIPVSHKWTDPVKGELNRPFEIVPAVAVQPSENMLVFTGNESKTFTVQLVPSVASISGTLQVKAPAGWKITPGEIPVALNGKDKKRVYEFTVVREIANAEANSDNTQLEIIFTSGGKSYNQQVRRIFYDHIPPLVRTVPGKVKLVNLSFTSKARKIGYIEGAGDDVAQCLKLAGFDVTLLNDRMIMRESLHVYDAIVTGIRAYNTNENMELYYSRLMDYVEQGGNLVVQYNTSNFISTLSSSIGPHPFRITRDRVTVEDSPVVFTQPGHFLLNTPNKITAADFEGWIQERGLYFAGEFAPSYQSVLSMNDPGEESKTGSVIIAKKGKGYFIYTGISFFRQLPAGVSGAYRLLVNMLNAGK